MRVWKIDVCVALSECNRGIGDLLPARRPNPPSSATGWRDTGWWPVCIPNGQAEVLGCSVLTNAEDTWTPKPVCKHTKQ